MGLKPETAVLPEWSIVASLSSVPFITQRWGVNRKKKKKKKKKKRKLLLLFSMKKTTTKGKKREEFYRHRLAGKEAWDEAVKVSSGAQKKNRR